MRWHVQGLCLAFQLHLASEQMGRGFPFIPHGVDYLKACYYMIICIYVYIHIIIYTFAWVKQYNVQVFIIMMWSCLLPWPRLSAFAMLCLTNKVTLFNTQVAHEITKGNICLGKCHMVIFNGAGSPSPWGGVSLATCHCAAYRSEAGKSPALTRDGYKRVELLLINQRL
jgi:hypothetical protein